MKIKYIDTYSTQLFHLQINACILKMLWNLYSDEVEYYSSNSSRANVIKLCEELSVVPFHSLKVIEPHNNIEAVLRTMFSAIQNIRMLLLSKHDDLLFYNYDNVFSLHLMNAINKFIKRKVVIVCHGELELLYPEVHGGLFAKMMSQVLRSFFIERREFNDNITFCVLSQSILHNINEILPSVASSHFTCFNHPYIYKGLKGKKGKKGNIINIGMVGTFSEEKGASDFLWLVQQLLNQKNVKFSVTGAITSRLEDLERLGVSLPSNSGQGLVSREEFSDRLEKLDFLLFLYPLDSYKLTASGAIMDAIEWGIPIIAIKNDYFCNMFENYGPFGYLVNDKYELKDVILSSISKDYDLKIDFDSIRLKSSPVEISGQLGKIIDNII